MATPASTVMETRGTERLGNLLEVTQPGHRPEPRSGCSPALAFRCPATRLRTPGSRRPLPLESVPQERGGHLHQSLRTGLCNPHPTLCTCLPVRPQQRGSEVALARSAQKRKGAREPPFQEGEQSVGTQVPVPQGEVPDLLGPNEGLGLFS